MDLNKPVGKVKYPVKTTVNLAMREKHNVESKAFVPTAIVLVVLIGLFCKFAVIDLLTEVGTAENEQATQSATLQSLRTANADYDEVQSKYESLGISSASLTGTMEPMECLSLIDETLISASTVESFTVSGDQIKAKISGVDLTIISSIYKNLMAYGSVKNVQIYTAATGQEGAGTTATLTIKLVSATDLVDTESGDTNGERGGE